MIYLKSIKAKFIVFMSRLGTLTHYKYIYLFTFKYCT